VRAVWDDPTRTCAGWRRAPHAAAGLIATNAYGGAWLCRACWLRWSSDDTVDTDGRPAETRRTR